MSESASKPTRVGLGNRAIVLLTMAVAIGGIWSTLKTNPTRKDEFRHDGETTREWFYKLPHKGSVGEREIEAAWQELGTNFFPICIEHLRKGKRLPMARAYVSAYFQCPKLFQKLLPVPNAARIRDETGATFWTLQGIIKYHPAVLQNLQAHLALLDDYATNPEFSEGANALIFLMRSGERELQGATNHISDPDFFVRVYASVTVAVSNWTNGVALKDCVPALVEAITNKLGMDREFRAMAGRLRQSAKDSLEKISPETPAAYSKSPD